MTLPTMLPHDGATVRAWCRAVDEGPWSSLAVPERTTYTSHDMTVQLSAAAALTERVRLWTTIIVLPAHDAVDMAKKLASVDVLSNGRLTAGIGVGGRDHDYLALGAPFERRWSRMDEQVDRMRSIWDGEPPFEGGDPVGPMPVQRGGPPLASGAMGPKAMARAAQWAVGVNGAWTITGDLSGLADGMALARKCWADAGKEPPHLSAGVWFALGDDADAQLHGYVHDYMSIMGPEIAGWMAGASVCNSAEKLAEISAACAEAGLDELFLVPTSSDVHELDRAREALGI